MILRFTHWVNIWTASDRLITLPLCMRTGTHLCVCVTFYSTIVFIPRFSISFIETLPSTTSSPVLIVDVTNHDKNLSLDNEYLANTM